MKQKILNDIYTTSIILLAAIILYLLWVLYRPDVRNIYLNQLQHLVNQASTGSGIVELENGTYVEEFQVVVPDGITIRGRGRLQTTIQGSGTLLDPIKQHFNIDKTVFKVGNNFTISDLTFDGQDGQVYGAIGFYGREHVTVERCNFDDLSAYYVLFSKSRHVRVSDCHMTNKGMGFDDYLIKMGASDHILIDNVTTSFDQGSHGGMSLGFTDFGSPYQIYDLVVQDCDLDGASTFAQWDQENLSPAFSIEFAFYTFNRCKIINNIIRRSASLVKLNFYVPEDTSWIIDNNQFLGYQGEEVMAIELGLPRAVITNNYFLNPQTVVAVFGGDGNYSTGDIDGVVFNNNVIETLGDRQTWLNALFYTQNAIKDLTFTNNTIDFNAGRSAAIFRNQRPGSNNNVSRNVIIADGQQYLFGDMSGFDIRENVAHPSNQFNDQGFPTIYDGNLPVEGQGDKPFPYYTSLHEGFGAEPIDYIPPIEPPDTIPPVTPPDLKAGTWRYVEKGDTILIEIIKQE